jgi:hypothetical protein
MSREGVLATYDAGCGRSVLEGGPSDLVQEAQNRTVIHNVLHPSQTVHVLTKNGAIVLCISNDCSAWVEQGWMENEHTLDFTGRPPCAMEEAVVEVEAVPIPAVIVVNGVRVSTQPIPFSYGDLRKVVEEGSDAVSPLYLWDRAVRKEAWAKLSTLQRAKMSDNISLLLKAYWAMEKGSKEKAALRLRGAAVPLFRQLHPDTDVKQAEWWELVSEHVAAKRGSN